MTRPLPLPPMRGTRPKGPGDLDADGQDEETDTVKTTIFQQSRVQWPARISAVIREFMLIHNFFSVSTFDRYPQDLFKMLWKIILDEREETEEEEFWAAHALEHLQKNLRIKIGSIRRDLLNRGIVIPNPNRDPNRKFILKETTEVIGASAPLPPMPSTPLTPTKSLAPSGTPSQSKTPMSGPVMSTDFPTSDEPTTPTWSPALSSRVFTEIEVITALRHFLHAVRAFQDPYPFVSELGEGASQCFIGDLIQVCFEAVQGETFPQWNDLEHLEMAELDAAAERLRATWQDGMGQVPFSFNYGENSIAPEN